MSALLTWICDIYEGKCRKRRIIIVLNQVPAIYNELDKLSSGAERQKLLVWHKMTVPLVDDSHLQNRSCVIFTMHIWKNWKLFVEKWQTIWLLKGMTTDHWDGLEWLRFLEALAGWWESYVISRTSNSALSADSDNMAEVSCNNLCWRNIRFSRQWTTKISFE